MIGLPRSRARDGNTKRIVFYAPTKSQADFDIRDFYQQDIVHLKELGFEETVVRKTLALDLFRSADLIYVWWFTRLLIPGVVARLKGIPCIAFGNAHAGSDTPGDLNTSRIKALIVRLGLSMATVVAVPSRAEASAISSSNLYNGVVKVVPHCVRSGGHADASASASARGHSVVPAGPYVLMIFAATAGNIERKRVAESIEAFGRFAEFTEGVRLVIAGQPGPGTYKLNELVRSSRHRDRIELRGRVAEDEKWQLLKGATLFLSLSQWEGFGLAIAEAHAAGSPVVADAVPAVVEHLAEAGYYPTSESIDDILLAMVAAASSKSPVNPPVVANETCKKKRLNLIGLFNDAGVEVPGGRLNDGTC